MQTKALVAPVVLKVALCVALLGLSTGVTFWDALAPPVQRSEDSWAHWLGTDYVKREIFDRDRRVSVLLATDVPLGDADAIVKAVRQGHLLNGLRRGAALYQERSGVLSIRKARWRLSGLSNAEYEAVTRAAPEGRSGAGLRVLVRDKQVEVRETFVFVNG